MKHHYYAVRWQTALWLLPEGLACAGIGSVRYIGIQRHGVMQLKKGSAVGKPLQEKVFWVLFERKRYKKIDGHCSKCQLPFTLTLRHCAVLVQKLHEKHITEKASGMQISSIIITESMWMLFHHAV